ncbi:hypothetical protein NKCBBBOE_02334 [Pseudarthrobacter sp. MM222]|nr:hypothetical protein NKCBBBOE_02334 [Pseudarthrobacter sp. MM222]
MKSPRLAAISLTPFKSYQSVRIPIEPLTVLIGRNASGKSNALDAFEVLGRLARGLEIRDALDGSLEGLAPIRGGSSGLAPAGSEKRAIKLAVEVEDPDYGLLTMETEIAVGPEPKIISERLNLAGVRGKKSFTVFESVPQDDSWRGDIDARVYSGKRGVNPRTTLRSSQLLTFQVPQRLDTGSAAKRLVSDLCNRVLASLLGVFHLDPIPSSMRQYVPEKDTDLHRDARNLSAVLAHLKDSGAPDTWARLTSAIQRLPEHPISGVEFVSTSFGDVMAGIRESFDDHVEIIPARQMSDGMLRMLAITTSILGGASSLAISPSLSGAESTPTLLIEELENGLHPSQAHALLQLIVESISSGEQQLVVTTHSPALLNALSGEQHRGVLIVSRDKSSGWSSVSRLIDLPGYHRALASEPLGSLVENGRISEAFESPVIARESIDDFLRMI